VIKENLHEEDRTTAKTQLLMFYGNVNGCKMWICLRLVLAMGPHNPPVVQFLATGWIRIGSRPSQKPDPRCLCGVVTWTRHKPVVVQPGRNWPTVLTLLFLHLWLQLSISVLIVSWHDQYGDCALLTALSPYLFRFPIRLIFIEWLSNYVQL